MGEGSIRCAGRTFLRKPVETIEQTGLGIRIRSWGFSIRILLEAISNVETTREHRKRVSTVNGAYAFFQWLRVLSCTGVFSILVSSLYWSLLYTGLFSVDAFPEQSSRKRSGFCVEAIPHAADRFQANLFIAVLSVLHIMAKPGDRNVNRVI